MKAKEMHPLCCISVESFGIGCAGDGDQSTEEAAAAAALCRTKSMPANGHRDPNPQSLDGPITGKGGDPDGFFSVMACLSYAKIRRPENLNLLASNNDYRLIGEISSNRIPRGDENGGGRRKHQKAVGVVHLKVLYLHCYKDSSFEKLIQRVTERLGFKALASSSRSISPLTSLNYNLTTVQVIYRGQLKFYVNDDLNLLDTNQAVRVKVSFEALFFLALIVSINSCVLNTDRVIYRLLVLEAELSGMNDGEFQLMKHDLSSEERGKYSECQHPGSSDDIEKRSSRRRFQTKTKCPFTTPERFFPENSVYGHDSKF
ncbi:Oxysterol-binding protein-related protein 2A, partial [Cucurbita argyrosperma subsp. argyrosperma]